MNSEVVELQTETGRLGLLRVGSSSPGATSVLFLHGFAMLPEDIAPFAELAASDATFFFPRGPVDVPAGTLGRERATAAWWPVDVEARSRAMAHGPRDLSEHDPPGVTSARRHLEHVVSALRKTLRPQALVVGGFSQGAMLTMEWQLQAPQPADAVVIMSGSRIRAPVWTPQFFRLRGLRVFQTHGRADPDLSFEAAERLRDLMCAHGAAVTWLPHEGGHGTHISSWRGLRRFLRDDSLGRSDSGART